jgi:hypothetical protein
MSQGGYLLDVNYFEALSYFRGHLSGIFFILCWQQNGLDTCSVGSNELFLDSADTLDVARQLEFTL